MIGERQWSRREILRIGAGVALGGALTGCASSSTTFEPADPHLVARPGDPTITPARGASALGLGGSRDGILYVPDSYDPATPAPLFIALHGAGGSAGAWASYHARAEARKMIFLAIDSRSQTWDLLLGFAGPDIGFLGEALEYTFSRCRIDPARICLAGFSDGATWAISMALANGDLFTHLAGYSPGGFFDLGRVGKPKVFVSHGIQDPILPVSVSRNVIVPTLRQEGYDVTFEEFVGFHEVPATISEAALDWFVA